MKRTDKNLYLLYMVFAIALITANCIASKVFTTGINLFGNPITLTTGALCYPITFLCTDIISELWGKEKATTAVKWGFVVQIISTLVIIIARYLPATDPEMQNAYVMLLGQNWVFVIASLVAYGCSQSWDVYMFHKIRNHYIKKHGTIKGGKWLWNNGGTITSQLLDSIIYASIAFGLGFGWLFDPSMRALLFNMILGQWLFKSLIALLDTPVFYLLTRNSTTVIEQ